MMDIKRPFENERSLFLFKPYKLQNKKGIPKPVLWYTFLRIFKQAITCISITVFELNDHMERSLCYFSLS